MKKQYRLREDEALHEWLDRLMESMPLRQLSDSDNTNGETDRYPSASLSFLYPSTNKTEKSK